MELWMPITVVFILGSYLLSRRPQPEPEGQCQRCSDADELNAVEEKRMLFDFLEKAHRTSLMAVTNTMETVLAHRGRDGDERAKRIYWERDAERKRMDDLLSFQEQRHRLETHHLEKMIQELERKIAENRPKQK